MKLKNIPAGNYTKISAVYIPLIEGQGCTCDNCGRLIANIVTVKNNSTCKTYTIGQDCAKNLFSDAENKAIDRQIKEGIRAEKYRLEKERRKAWQEAYDEVMSLYYSRGGDSSKINEQGDRDIYNACLAQVSELRKMHIGYQR